MANSALDAIEKKMRRITRCPMLSQLSVADAREYINTFILYDIPQRLKLFSLRTTLTFYTKPYVDVYETNTTDVNDPLYDFKNRYTAVHQPVYIAGINAFYTQQRDQFFNFYPQPTTIAQSGLVGNGGTGPFSGVVVAHPILQRSLIFSCLDASGNPMNIVDYPLSGSTGALGLVGVPEPILPSPYGQINYITGEFSGLFFEFNTLPGAPIQVQNYAYQPGKSQSVLFYDNKFTLRPVPIDVYPVTLDADILPTELLSQFQTPDIKQWWQYIAYGASKKLFEDRMDTDSIQRIMPEFINQETLVERSTVELGTNERTPTIYSSVRNFGPGWFGAQWPY